MQFNDMEEWLSENPKMMGCLFAILMVLSQAGQVAAIGSGNPGP